MNKPRPFFSEHDYLAANKDVQRAKATGQILSGWHHYLHFGWKEQRPGVDEGCRDIVCALLGGELLTPPGNLMQRVHGSSNEVEFNQTGRHVALDLYKALEEVNHQPGTIYEFGCGCGRVLVPLRSLWPQATIAGSDIDKQALEWLRANLPGGGGQIRLFPNADAPPTLLPPDSQDFVYAISVFTHIPETLANAWMRELHRIMKPGAVLIATTQGESLIWPHISDAERAAFTKSGIFYKHFLSTEGLPDYYQATWHMDSYILNQWTHLFDLKSRVRQGIAGHQDLNLFVKR